MKWSWAIMAIFISMLFLTSAVIQPWLSPEAIDLKVERLSGPEGSAVRVNYSISSSMYSDPINIVLVPVTKYGTGNVYIFLDKDSVTLEGYARVLGLYDHLRAEMKSLGMNQPVHVIDHEQVADILNGDPSVLIIANSTTNWIGQSDSMLSWVKKGGLVIGLGEGALPFVTENNVDPSVDGKSLFQVHYDALDYAGGDGISMSEFAQALGMEYQSPRFGMRIADIDKYGRSVGFIYQRTLDLTSAALIQIGVGAVILTSDVMVHPFAASMEDVIAQDLARMLACSLPWSAGEPFVFKVNGAGGIDGSFVVRMNTTDQIVCFAYSTANHQHRYRILVS